jgi:hypothetical protein
VAVVATSTTTRPAWSASPAESLVSAAYALGAVGLAGEAVVHVQQYFSLYNQVNWIGPLFLVNALACIVAIAGLAYAPARQLAAAAGIAVSVVALGSLVVSYGHGLFGWQEGGWKPAITLIVIFDTGTVIFLSAGLAAKNVLPPRRAR